MSGHYVTEPKTGIRTWVGPTNDLVRSTESRLELARAALQRIKDLYPKTDAGLLAAEAIRRIK